MSRSLTRRRFVAAGIFGAGALATGGDRLARATWGAAGLEPHEGEHIMDATASDGALYVLSIGASGRRVRQELDLRAGRQRSLTAMDELPIEDAFEATAFTSGVTGLVGSLRSTRSRSFSADLRWQLPNNLRHLTETMPTSGSATVDEEVWEPAASELAHAAARLDAVAGTFGHVVAASAPMSTAGAGRGAGAHARPFTERSIVQLGFTGQLIADVVRVALLHGDTIVAESPIGHHETVVDAHVDHRTAVAIVRGDDGALSSIDLTASPPRRDEIGDVQGDVALARWRSGLVLTATGEETRTWYATPHDTWTERRPRRRRHRRSPSDVVIPVHGTDDLFIATDGETFATVEL